MLRGHFPFIIKMIRNNPILYPKVQKNYYHSVFIFPTLMASLVADSPMVSSVSEEKDVVVYAVRVSYYLDRKLYHNSRICILEKVKKHVFFSLCQG